MPDQPIAYTAEGHPVYNNTPTVVVVLVTIPEKKLLAVRRANNPGYGLLGLPGGYHMRGESWQEAGAREVMEETGHNISPVSSIGNLVTDEYGNNLQFGFARSEGVSRNPTDGEALEILELTEAGEPEDWAFPRHYEIAKDFLDHLSKSE